MNAADPTTFCGHGQPMTPGTLHGDHCQPMSHYMAEMGW